SLEPSRQLAGGVANPPVHAGMVPAALPARSAPTGVNSLFSRSASASDTFATAAPEKPITTAATAATKWFRIPQPPLYMARRSTLAQLGCLFASFKRSFQVNHCSFL